MTFTGQEDLALLIDLIHRWQLFHYCFVIVEICQPSLTEATILSNLAHSNEASGTANLHKDKRIMNWQPFMNNVYWWTGSSVMPHKLNKALCPWSVYQFDQLTPIPIFLLSQLGEAPKETLKGSSYRICTSAFFYLSLSCPLLCTV